MTNGSTMTAISPVEALAAAWARFDRKLTAYRHQEPVRQEYLRKAVKLSAILVHHGAVLAPQIATSDMAFQGFLAVKDMQYQHLHSQDMQKRTYTAMLNAAKDGS